MSKESPIKLTDNWFAGADKVLEFAVTKPDGTAQDITGFTFELVMRKGGASGPVVFTKITGSGIVITNAVGGLFEVTIARADTLSLRAGLYYYTARRTNAGLAEPLAFGDAFLRLGATR